MEDPEVRSRGQHSSTRDEPSKREEDIKTGDTRIRTITVGGIPLFEYMKKKKTMDNKKTTPLKRKKDKSPRKAPKTTLI